MIPELSRRYTRREFLRIGSLAAAGFLLSCRVKNRFQLVIRNGTIIDGTGRDGFQADLGIQDGVIVAIGDLQGTSTDRVIDASGLVVTPGFIDIHTHTDMELLVNPTADSKIFQGVTLEVSGNCGSSPFPYLENDFQETRKYYLEKYGIEIDWRDIDGFLSRLEQGGLALNYITLTGQGDLRAYFVGKNDQPASREQIKKMQSYLAETLEKGSFGLSTGLEYAPGCYASTEELIALCKVVKEKNKIYATHMRNEDDTVEEALTEAIRIAKESNVRLQISHLKACNKANWHKVDRLLEMIHHARKEGVNVFADRYPYIAYGTGLTIFVPREARQGSTDDLLKRLQLPEWESKIKAYLNSRGERIGGWERVLISYCFSEKNKPFEGKSIKECCEITAQTPFEFIRDLLIEERTRVSIVGFAMTEENLEKIYRDPLVMVGSDGNAIENEGVLAMGKPHPRYYGTFPRFLGRYVRDKGLISLPEAIRRITGMPAEQLNLQRRGIIAKGKQADITIFDYKKIIDKATFTRPHQYAEGVNYVIVNGELVLEKGKITSRLPGKVLRTELD